MNRITELLSRALRTEAAAPGAGTPARRLLERAAREAGHDPREAQALRDAAQAWLRVVR